METELTAQNFLTKKGKPVKVISQSTRQFFRKIEMFQITLQFSLAPLDYAAFQNNFLSLFEKTYRGKGAIQLSWYWHIDTMCMPVASKALWVGLILNIIDHDAMAEDWRSLKALHRN